MPGFTETSFGLLILSLALVATVHGGTCPPGVQSPNDCLYTSSFSALNQGDPGRYCDQGAILSAQAKNCLRDCNYNENDPTLLAQMKKINTFCSNTVPDGSCPNVTDTYVSQTRCFDQYGGIPTVLQNAIAGFETKEGTSSPAFDRACIQLSWGRYILNEQTCSYNQELNATWIQQNRAVITTMGLCGSEELTSTLDQMDLTSGCGSTDYSTIASKCNISCAVANAPNAQALCSVLEGQATCLQTNIVNCTAAERSLVLPRINMYAIANQYLGCSIKYNGFIVKPTGLTSQYSSLINACLFAGTVENAIVFERLQPLINGDLLVNGFCSTAATQSSNLATCRNLFAGAFTPQIKLLTRAIDQKYNLDQTVNFYPSMGGFPLDNYAMAYLYKTTVCPAQFSKRLCVPASDQPPPTTSAAAKPVAPGSIDNPVDYSRNSAGALTPTILLIVSATLSIMY